jgi:hypothetical protein
MFIIIWWHLYYVKKCGAMVKDLISQCGGEGFKSLQLQPSPIKLIKLG